MTEFATLPPEIRTAVPGPRSLALLERLARAEAPGLTLPGGIVWAEAEGANVIDADGNRFVDLTAAFGVAGIGHRNPRVAAAVERQAAQLLHGMGDVYAHEARVALAERIVALAPVDDGRVFLAGGGAEAVEIALKTAALATGRPGVLAFSGAYHGLTFGALAPTSRDAFRSPFLAHLSPHVVRAPYPYPFRWPGSGDGAAESLAQVAALLAAPRETPIGAVLVEPVQGREGEIVPPDGWLRGLRQLCDEHGALLIADEIFTGWGRTGRLWGVDHDGVRPDLICVGKGMTGGLPLAACVGRAELMEAWRVEGEPLHTATFMGHPLGCA
ncbi:MAG TPA: aspartate aminotransferase family protein, partial [Herpetosiphonaceae bacterium]